MPLSIRAKVVVGLLVAAASITGTIVGIALAPQHRHGELAYPPEMVLVAPGLQWASGGPYTDNTDMVSFVYSHQAKMPERQAENFHFFIRHGLQTNVDYVFTINGDAPAEILAAIPRLGNIFIIHKDNRCFDLGSHAIAVDFAEQKTGKRYQRLAFLNSSVRGPFLRLDVQGCWTDRFFEPLNDKVKLVGTIHGCVDKLKFFMQSMALALDRVGFDLSRDGTFRCFSTLRETWRIGEAGNLARLKEYGYEGAFLAAESAAKHETCEEGERSGFDYWNNDPTEIISWKTNRGGFDEAKLNEITDLYDRTPSRCPYHIPPAEQASRSSRSRANPALR